jgi:hypothetical protein
MIDEEQQLIAKMLHPTALGNARRGPRLKGNEIGAPA